MPSLPIPLISSFVLGFLLIRMVLTNRRYGLLGILLALCAAQGVIISLAQHYGVPGFRIIQPVTATFIPPMAWIAFQVTAVRGFDKTDWINIAGPFCAAIALATAPGFLNTFIPLLFVGYGAAIYWQSLGGADALPRLRLESGDMPMRLWQIIGVSLMASALSDVLIVMVRAVGATYLQPWIISGYSGIMLLVVGGVALSTDLITTQSDAEDDTAPQITDQDVEIVAQLERLMQDQKPYLNPDLSLVQLSRKLIIPVKQLSAAINKVTGENVSRYINAARIKAAQDALCDGQSVTQAMFSAGFNTKSNFNREFLRVTGNSPSDWIAHQNHTSK